MCHLLDPQFKKIILDFLLTKLNDYGNLKSDLLRFYP